MRLIFLTNKKRKQVIENLVCISNNVDDIEAYESLSDIAFNITGFDGLLEFLNRSGPVLKKISKANDREFIDLSTNKKSTVYVVGFVENDVIIDHFDTYVDAEEFCNKNNWYYDTDDYHGAIDIRQEFFTIAQ